MKVEQIVAACHTGFRSCFYRKWESGNLVTVGEKMFEEEDVYKKG
jgi:hypothetical protein